MPIQAGIVVAMVVALTMAGCAQSQPADVQSADPASTEAAPTESTGSIGGTVTDDEGLPLAGARVALVETTVEAVTGPDGGFAFNDLDPGTYTVLASRIGYEDAAQRVDVAAGQVAQIEFSLSTVVLAAESYLDMEPFRARVVFGQSFVDIATHEATSLVCDPCHFHPEIELAPEDVIIEATFEGAATVSPVLNDDVFVAVFKNFVNDTTKYRNGQSMGSGYLADRGSIALSAGGLEKEVDDSMLRIDVHAGVSIAVEMDVELWMILAYHDGLPSDFTGPSARVNAGTFL